MERSDKREGSCLGILKGIITRRREEEKEKNQWRWERKYNELCIIILKHEKTKGLLKQQENK